VRLSGGGIYNNVLAGSWTTGNTPSNSGIATGTSSPVNPQTWTIQGNKITGYRFGLNLDGSGGVTGTIADNCISQNQRGIQTQSGLHDIASNIQILTNDISNNEQGIRVARGNTTIHGNTISNNTVFGISPGVASATLDNLTITENFISGSPAGLLFVNNFSSALNLNISSNSITSNTLAINSTVSSSIPATCNWFGIDDYDDILLKISGSVTFQPYLVDGTDAETGTTGFQPVTPNTCTNGPVAITATPDNILCGDEAGSILVEITGGTAPFVVSWTGPTSGTQTVSTEPWEYNIPTLVAGTYSILVEAVGSQASTSAVIQDLPVKNATANTFHPTIQAAITAATPGDVIEVCAGTYVEDLEVDKSITLLGPNAGISPNTETRVAEATIIPFETDAAQAYITASDVTIDGFTFNGNNPSLASGYPGTNGADIDAAAAVYQNADNINNLVVKNNIIQNQTYMGIYLFGGSYSAPSTTGNLIDDNLFKDLGHYGTGLSYANWGGGVMLYNNQYTRITNNVMQNVRIGIQTGNFSRANIGSSDYQVIANNTIEARRRGIFHNLHYGPTSPYTLSNNNITALDNTNESVWDGIFFGSMSVDAFGINNTINGSGVTNPSEGIEIWNVKSTTPVRISGGSVSNVDIGVFANNFEGYNSNGTDGAHAVISGVTITPKTGGVGVKAYDSPSYTGVPALVSVEVKDNCSISGAANGILAEGADASVTVTNNLTTITNNQVGIRVKDGADLASVTGNTITNNTHGGIIIEATAGDIGEITDNTISGNGNSVDAIHGLGLQNELADVVDVRNNYWGDASGPYHTLYNTCGLGNAVVGPVDISPWLNETGDDEIELLVHNVQKDTWYCKIQDAINDADYAVEIGGGAVATITNCTVSGNTGVASTDGSTSAGILATTYFGTGTKATITGSTFTGNTTGINVGYDETDQSIVIANNNKIYGNTEFGISSTGPSVNAAGNWWGTVTGPTYIGNPCGTGDAVSDNVIYDCWKGDDALTIEVCQLQAFTVSGTSSVCVDNTSADITLSGSQNGVVYDLYANNTLVAGEQKPGTGGILIWTVIPTENTVYTVKAKNSTSLCELPMTGSATIYYGPVTTAPEIQACPGTLIQIPITVRSFTEVQAISLTLQYDATKMTFAGFTNGTIVFDNDLVMDRPVTGTDFRKIIISNEGDFSLTDINPVLITLNFNYINGYSELKWLDSPDSWCEYTYPNPDGSFETNIYCDDPTGNYYINGSVMEDTYLSSYISGLELTMNETFDYAPACIASGDEISSIQGTGSMVALFDEMNNLPANIIVVEVAGYELTGDQVTDGAAIKAALIDLMEDANPLNNTVGGLNGKNISVPVVYGYTTYTGCEQTATFLITFNTAIPEAQQALEDYVAAQNQANTSTETFDYDVCIASGDLINTIEGTGTMVELAAQIAALEAAGQIEVVSIAGVTDLTMANIKAAITFLMEESNPVNNTVGGLDGLSISIPVIYANAKSTGDCEATVTYTITYDTEIPEAQQALKDYVASLETELEEDFAGLCLEGDDLISEISGTGKMVELFAQIANLQSGGQIKVLSVAGITYTGEPANMAAIAAAIKALMIAQTTNGTIHELDEKSISIPVVFANALNTGCTSPVNFVFTFDTAIPDQPLTVTCPANISVNNTPGSCDASVTFEATASAGELYPITIVYKVGGNVINSPHTFSVGTTTVNVSASNQCKTVECSFTVTVNDNQQPVITCPADVTIDRLTDAGPHVTGYATAVDNCTESGDILISFADNRDGLTGCNGTGTLLRTWKAKDASNNELTCVQTITVTDIISPVIADCPDNILQSNDPGDCGALITWTTPDAKDLSHFQGFEHENWFAFGSTDWNNSPLTIERVISGTNGINSKTGTAHANLTQTSAQGGSNYTRLGGYQSDFGEGFRVAQDIYIDLLNPLIVNATATTGYGFDLAAAVSKNTIPSDHLRDFIFHTAAYDASGVWVMADNNTNNARRNNITSAANKYKITSGGWYTFEWIFRNQGGVLAVDCRVLDAGGTVLWTETRSDAGDLISSVVGGNRYLWFTYINCGTLPIDNTTLEYNATLASAPLNGSVFDVGTTSVTYTATDACGKTSTCTFNVTVNDTEKPVITLLGNATEYVCQNSTYTDAGATATDNCDGPLTGSIVTTGLPVTTSTPGTYIITYNVNDAANNTATEVTRTVVVNPLPVVSEVELLTSVDQNAWAAVSGTLALGYEMCIDPVISYHYYDIDALTSSIDLKTTDFVQNAFKLDVTSVPTGFYAYWDARGVNSSATPGAWQAVMHQIITGAQPMFYIQKDGTDYKLIDGLQYQFASVTSTLRINGEYPAGDYKFTGKVTDVNGCESLPFDVMLKLNSAPVITCPGNITVGNTVGQCGASVSFAATATGVPPTTIVYTLADNTEIFSGHFFPVGTTMVTATASNICKDVTCTFTVTVNDTEKPVITLLGDATVELCENETYTDAGATATDNCNGDLTASIVTVDPVDTDVPATYTVTYNVTDVATNAAIQVTRTVIVNPLPEVTAVTLQTSINESSWSAISGNLDDGYEMCIDPVVDYHYYDINTLTSSIDLKATDFVQNAFKLDVNSVPSGFYAYWDAKGVNSSAIGGWEAVMYQIINGVQPMFYIQKDGADYKLIDGLQYQFANVVKTLRINGEYPAGDYKFRGTVTDVNECVSLQFNVMLKLNSAPVISCPANYVVNNDPGECGANVTFAATATGTPTPDITYMANGNPITSGAYFPVGTTTVTATASNACSNVICTFTVKVNDTEKPVITRTGDATVYVCQNESYTDLGATASDNCTLTGSVVTGGSVNTAVPGSYTITYNISDDAGNPADEVTRTVIVREMPEVDFSVNSTVLSYPVSSVALCYSENLEFKLNSIKKGTGPIDLTWTITYTGSGTPPVLPTSATDVIAGGTLFSTTAPLVAGTYEIQVTSLNDVFGCEISEAVLNQYYKATITVNPEPSVTVTHTDLDCYQAGNGSVTFTPDVAGTYIYTLGAVSSGPQTGVYTFTGLDANTYTWTMTDVTTTCVSSDLVKVNQPAAIPLSGTVKYHNSANSPLDKVTVILKQSGSTDKSTITDNYGNYLFNNVCPGTYEVEIVTPLRGNELDYINSSDAGVVNRWSIDIDINGNNPTIEKVRFLAGDVGDNLTLNANDASRIQRYFVNEGKGSNAFNKPWEFWREGVTVNTLSISAEVMQVVISSGSTGVTQNFLGMVSGDFNQSYEVIPVSSSLTKAGSKPAKTSSKSLTLIEGKQEIVVPGTLIDLPIRVVDAMQVGAISLILNYPADQLKIEGVFLQNKPELPLEYNIVDDRILIGWNSINPITLAAGETMLTIRLRMTGSNKGKASYFKLAANPLNELADGSCAVINNATLIMDGLKTGKGVEVETEIPESISELLMNCYPNPFGERATIRYKLPEDGRVYLEVTGILGNRVTLMSNQQQLAGEYLMDLDGAKMVSGVYQVTLRFTNQFGKEWVQTVRMIKQ
jgi:hypothetical protein